MHAALCIAPGNGRVELRELPDPQPGQGQLLLAVRACGVCRTDLHVVDGELPGAKVPVVPGHEVVGEVLALGAGVAGFGPGQRVGVPWLGWTCGRCGPCRAGRENLCAQARFTGCTLDGGFATRIVADARYCFHLPAGYADVEAAPLLCAGLIGHRAFRLAGEGRVLGLYGFGAAAHILAQTAQADGRTVFAFTRPGDGAAQRFARGVGCAWAGAADAPPPEPLDAAILFAPVGALVPLALAAVRPGGTVVCAGIHMSDVPSFPYRLLWQERVLRSVANLTRADAVSFLQLAATTRIAVRAVAYPLARADEALADLRHGRLQGAAVLVP
jgi:propanol-preferring alcohol dehydrogenase